MENDGAYTDLRLISRCRNIVGALHSEGKISNPEFHDFRAVLTTAWRYSEIAAKPSQQK